jgi:hypothetical protein
MLKYNILFMYLNFVTPYYVIEHEVVNLIKIAKSVSEVKYYFLYFSASLFLKIVAL